MDSTVLDADGGTSMRVVLSRLFHRVWGDRRLRYGAVVVVVVAVAAGAAVVRGREATGVASVAGHARSPAQVGVSYLTALAQGSAGDALAYLETEPGSTVFMTDAVLAESARLSPITDIKVLASSHDKHDHGEVTVSYRLGETRVIDTYPVERSHGFWFLVGGRDGDVGPGFVDVKVEGAAAMEITLNGVQVEGDSDQVQLFPGTYRLGSANTMLATSDVLVVPGLSPSLGGTTDLTPDMSLTAQARQAVADALTATLDGCLQETTLTTSCGLLVSPIWREGVKDDATVQWAVTPGSTDIAETEPQVLSGQYVTASCQGPEDGLLWAYWSGTSFEEIGALAVTTTAAGDVVEYDDSIYTYGVEISDPDHLKVHLRWLDSSLNLCRGSETSR